MPLTWQQAVAMYLQLLDAVDWMHHRLASGVFCLHRDISPGNVVVSWPRGVAGLPSIKLVDFGLSEVRTRARARRAAHLHSPEGSPRPLLRRALQQRRPFARAP